MPAIADAIDPAHLQILHVRAQLLAQVLQALLNGRPVIPFEGIGDEAFWDPLTGGVNLRVGNVLASIQASARRRTLSDSDPVQVELERRVAAQIARGLQSMR